MLNYLSVISINFIRTCYNYNQDTIDQNFSFLVWGMSEYLSTTYLNIIADRLFPFGNTDYV